MFLIKFTTTKHHDFFTKIDVTKFKGTSFVLQNTYNPKSKSERM